jgi:hypothetical protein
MSWINSYFPGKSGLPDLSVEILLNIRNDDPAL